jgi:stage IV sporulation protein FB
MILGEPPPTQADLRFSLFGFPVRVHPFFWLIALMLGMGGDTFEPVAALVWVVVVFVSILVHELGHAFLQRRYGGRPWIVLHGFGGLAICDDCDRAPRSQIIISLAGPAAGFLLATLIVLGLWLSGRGIAVLLLGLIVSFQPGGVEWMLSDQFGLFAARLANPFASRVANLAIYDLLYVNILWGMVNLLPIYPLDGGRVAREVFTLRNPRQGIVQSLQLSIGAAILVAVYALVEQSIFMCLMFGVLAYGSYQALQAYQNHWR